MATLEKVRITLPGGKKFVGTGNIEVVETQEAFWLFDGALSELRFVNDAYEDVWG